MPTTLNGVKILKIDLEHLRGSRNNIPHMLVTRDSNSEKAIFIRFANSGEVVPEETLKDLGSLHEGNIVDVEVELVSWKIGRLSGNSYIYRGIKR